MLKLSFFTLVILCLCSCRKDKTPDGSGSVVYPNYSNYAIGNYWVYQVYDIDTNGKETMTQDLDSMWVAGDTLIRGNTYYKIFQEAKDQTSLLNYRDSLHYIVDHERRRWNGFQDF